MSPKSRFASIFSENPADPAGHGDPDSIHVSPAVLRAPRPGDSDVAVHELPWDSSYDEDYDDDLEGRPARQTAPTVLAPKPPRPRQSPPPTAPAPRDWVPYQPPAGDRETAAAPRPAAPGPARRASFWQDWRCGAIVCVTAVAILAGLDRPNGAHLILGLLALGLSFRSLGARGPFAVLAGFAAGVAAHFEPSVWLGLVALAGVTAFEAAASDR